MKLRKLRKQAQEKHGYGDKVKIRDKDIPRARHDPFTGQTWVRTKGKPRRWRGMDMWITSLYDRTWRF